MPIALGGNITMTRHIKASPSDVFKAWTVPAEYKKWGAPGPATVAECEFDARVGGTYRIKMETPEGMPVVSGTYKEVVSGKKLVFTWAWEDSPNPASLVTIELTAKDGGTDMLVTHTGLADEEDVKHHSMGWEGCLANLQALHA